MGWSDITMSSHNLQKSRISSLLGIHNIRQQLYNTFIAKGPWRCIVRSNHKVKLSSNSCLILKQPAQNNIKRKWTKGESLGKRFSRNAFQENEKRAGMAETHWEISCAVLQVTWLVRAFGESLASSSLGFGGKGWSRNFPSNTFGSRDILITTNYQTYKYFGVAKNCAICHFSHQLN